MKKVIILVLVVVTLLLLSSPINAATGNVKIDSLIDMGLVRGDNDGYRLTDPIRRSEIAAMVTRVVEAESIAKVLEAIPSVFSDVREDSWANGYINYVQTMGYVNGYTDGTFKPNKEITYSEIVKILVLASGENPDLQGYDGSFWSIPYILKAIEVGILDGVTIPDGNYNSPATRGKVFEMVYNALVGKLIVENEHYKVLIVGNVRTTGSKLDELWAVVIDNKDNVRKANPRFRIGSNIDIIFQDYLEQEELLGKVIDIVIDKENFVQKYEIDNSYDYYIGPFLAEENSIMLTTGEKLSIIVKNRSSEVIPRLHSIYHNDKLYNYSTFLEEMDSVDGIIEGEYISEFSRITSKNGIVYFVDSYDFDDIAPVESVISTKNSIFIYDDYNGGAIKEVVLESVYGFYKGNFVDLSIFEILPEDVVHLYGDKAIVRMDAVYSGEYYGVDDSGGVSYVVISDQYFQVRNTNLKKPVYSLDGQSFSVLNEYEAYDTLLDLTDKRAIFIIDVNDSLQLISSYY